VDDETLARILDAAFDFLCQRRLNELVDVTRLLAAADAAATEPRVGRLIARIVAPARARLVERAKKSALLLGVWLPEPARDAMASLLGMPAPIPRKLIDAVVADEHVRENVRAMLQEALQNVIHKGFAAAPGGRGLRGMIGLAGAAGRGLFGGIGEELQRQLEERVRDFVDGGVQLLQQRIAQKLASEETARLLGRRRRRAFLDLLQRPESEVARWAEHAPWLAIDALLPSLVTHNLARAEVRDALKTELAAAIAELSAQTIGAEFDELGLRDAAREAFRAHLGPLARAFVASPEFARAVGGR
jgi:hypothetical protein